MTPIEKLKSTNAPAGVIAFYLEAIEIAKSLSEEDFSDALEHVGNIDFESKEVKAWLKKEFPNHYLTTLNDQGEEDIENERYLTDLALTDVLFEIHIDEALECQKN